MERLTMWYDGNHAVCKNENCDMDCCPFADPVCDEVQKVIDRLSEIENILGDEYDLDRLSVMINQCMSMRDEVAERFRLTAKIPLDRLKELVEADRDGRCVVLPCELGTQVWCIAEVAKYGYPDPVFEKQLFLRPFKIEWAGNIGKTMFLTREAAEAALKGERDG